MVVNWLIVIIIRTNGSTHNYSKLIIAMINYTIKNRSSNIIKIYIYSLITYVFELFIKYLIK